MDRADTAYGMTRFELYFIVFMLIVLVSSLAYIYYSYKHAPPNTNSPVLIKYWSFNNTCVILLNDKPADKIAFVTNSGILIARFNATIFDNANEKLGYLYSAPGSCPEWLPSSTIYIVESKH